MAGFIRIAIVLALFLSAGVVLAQLTEGGGFDDPIQVLPSGPPGIHCGAGTHICVIDGNITSSMTFIDGNTYVIAENIWIMSSGTSVTIEPGVVIKLAPNKSLLVGGLAELIVNGTPDKNIIFTSCKDQSAYAGSTNHNTSSVTNCSGTPAAGDYNAALWIRISPSPGTQVNSISYAQFKYGRVGIHYDDALSMQIHDNQFSQMASVSGAPSAGIRFSRINSATVYNNLFSNMGANSAGVRFDSTNTSTLFGPSVFSNRFEGFSSGAGVLNVNAYSAMSVYSNHFTTFSGTAVGVQTGSGSGSYPFVGAVNNNLFESFSDSTKAIQLGGNTSSSVRNNTIVNATGSVIGIANVGSFSGQIQRNLFANIPTGLSGSFGGTVSHNAYYNVATVGGDGDDHANDQSPATGFSAYPFVAAGNYLYLLNSDSAGGAKLVDAGGSAVDSFFAARTTQASNQLDTGLTDIGYHYVQSKPYSEVVFPQDGNVLSGTAALRFRVHAGTMAPSAVSVLVSYSMSPSVGTTIVSQNLGSFSCSGNAVYDCTFNWNTAQASNGTYYLVIRTSTAAGMAVHSSVGTFSVSNSSGPSGPSGTSKVCGNLVCETGETPATCPADCPAVCGDRACTHTENRTTCPLDCAVGCGNTLCEAGESATSCPQDCGQGGPVTVIEEQPLASSDTSPTSVEGIRGILGTSGVSLVENALTASGKVSVRRNFILQKVAQDGRIFSRIKVVLTVSNLSNSPIKDIALFETIPVSLLSDLSLVTSQYPFRIVEAQHALQFLVPALFGFQTTQVEYIIPVALTEEQADLFVPPLSVGVSEATLEEVTRLQCSVDADCGDSNLCTADRCIRNICYAVAFPEGAPCDIGAVCKQGICSNISTTYEQPPLIDPVTIGAIVLILGAVFIIAFEYFKN